MIKSIYDFITHFPPGSIKELTNEFHSPCPFCPPEGEYTTIVYKNHTFCGDDRLVWFLQEDRFYCRRCEAEGRKSVFSLNDMAFHFGVEFDPFAVQEVNRVGEEKPLHLWTQRKVVECYTQVKRDYWYNFGWTDEVIDTYKLGWGKLYTNDEFGHLIPMKVRTPFEGPQPFLYYVEARIPNVGKKRLAGSARNYFWHIDDDEQNDVVVVVEGPKDGITATLMGFKNVIVAFGANYWTREKAEYCLRFDKIISLGDNDPGGEYLNHSVSRYAIENNQSVSVIKWQESDPDGADLTDLYVRGDWAEYLESRIEPVEFVEQQLSGVRSAYIADYATVDPYYVPEQVDVVDISVVRGNGDNSILKSVNDFLDEYPRKMRRGYGLLHLLSVAPGAGKTHTLVRVAERVAQEALQQKIKERIELVNSIQQTQNTLDNTDDPDERQSLTSVLETLNEQLENFSVTSVLWLSLYKNGWSDLMSTGANSNLWYDYHARNPDNCVNFRFASELGRKGHDVGGFCKIACPFRDKCIESGYLKQEKESAQAPIGVYRHQHLLSKSITQRYKDLVVIDESPFHILENPIRLRVNDLSPHDNAWHVGVDNQDVIDKIRILVQSVRQAMTYNAEEPTIKNGERNPQYIISGNKFYEIVNQHIVTFSSSRLSLENILAEDQLLTVVKGVYQPPYFGENIADIKPRYLVELIEVMAEEFETFQAYKSKVPPSRLHLVSGVLEIYPVKRVRISSYTPIIAADATAMIPELYGAVFNREISVYAPKIRNPNARVVQVRGSDWTLKQLDTELGVVLRDREHRLTDRVYDLLGREFLFREIPTHDDLYQSKLVKEYTDVILSIVSRHKNVLIVLHKRIRYVIEDLFRYAYPETYERIAFGHYGALRGTNEYKDFEAVLLIGVSRIPYDVLWRKIQAWAYLLQMDEDIPLEMGYHPSPYHTLNEGHTHYTFNHLFAQRFVDMVEMGEMIQSQERIRPHSTDREKYVYIFANRPAANYVNLVATKSDVLNDFRGDSKLNQITAHIYLSFMNTGKIPTKRDIMKQFSCSHALYKKARERAYEQLGF